MRGKRKSASIQYIPPKLGIERIRVIRNDSFVSQVCVGCQETRFQSLNRLRVTTKGKIAQRPQGISKSGHRHNVGCRMEGRF